MEYKNPDISLLIAVAILLGASIGLLHGRIKHRADARALAQRLQQQSTRFA